MSDPAYALTRNQALLEIDSAWKEERVPMLDNADLSGADLRGADLSGGNMFGVNLADANLSGAYICGAYLRKANSQCGESDWHQFQ